MFGHIIDNYFVGDWFAVKDRLGYFGRAIASNSGKESRGREAKPGLVG